MSESIAAMSQYSSSSTSLASKVDNDNTLDRRPSQTELSSFASKTELRSKRSMANDTSSRCMSDDSVKANLGSGGIAKELYIESLKDLYSAKSCYYCYILNQYLSSS